jgi:hypothetical protein
MQSSRLVRPSASGIASFPSLVMETIEPVSVEISTLVVLSSDEMETMPNENEPTRRLSTPHNPKSENIQNLVSRRRK